MTFSVCQHNEVRNSFKPTCPTLTLGSGFLELTEPNCLVNFPPFQVGNSQPLDFT